MSFARVLHQGPLESRILSLSKQLEERPVRRLRHGWRLWKFHREFDTQQPELSRWTWRFPRGQIPDCASCLDNCCRGPRSTVLLRLVDVAMLVDRGLTEQMTLHKPTFCPETLAQKPLLKALVGSFHWRVFPVLKQRPEEQTCVFLSEGRCQIHAHRPWICRVFPYALNIDELAVEWSPRCQHPRAGDPRGKEAQELSQAVFRNFYQEKVRDLLLVQVYREELEATGITQWLNLP